LKITKVLNADKKKREQEEQQKKDDEIEELRRRLAEFEKQNAEQTPPQPTEMGAADNEQGAEAKTE
jgi:hypothetical protein